MLFSLEGRDDTVAETCCLDPERINLWGPPPQRQPENVQSIDVTHPKFEIPKHKTFPKKTTKPFIYMAIFQPSQFRCSVQPWSFSPNMVLPRNTKGANYLGSGTTMFFTTAGFAKYTYHGTEPYLGNSRGMAGTGNVVGAWEIYPKLATTRGKQPANVWSLVGNMTSTVGSLTGNRKPKMLDTLLHIGTSDPSVYVRLSECICRWPWVKTMVPFCSHQNLDGIYRCSSQSYGTIGAMTHGSSIFIPGAWKQWLQRPTNRCRSPSADDHEGFASRPKRNQVPWRLLRSWFYHGLHRGYTMAI